MSDIGVETVMHFLNALEDAKPLIWNGPMGVFEDTVRSRRDRNRARCRRDRGAIVIVSGGGSVAAVTKAGVADRITHISTGGGATLESGGEDCQGGAAYRDK